MASQRCGISGLGGIQMLVLYAVLVGASVLVSTAAGSGLTIYGMKIGHRIWETKTFTQSDMAPDPRFPQKNPKKNMSGIATSRQLLAEEQLANSGGSAEPFTRFDSEVSLGTASTIELDNVEYPFSVIGQLVNGCSGFLVGPCHMLTVAHCIYEPNHRIWWPGSEFNVARNGPQNWAPYGAIEKRNALVPDEWKQGKNFEYDFAMVVLKESIGDEVGWFEFGYDMSQDLVRGINVAGYPAYENDPQWVNGTMYYDYCSAKLKHKRWGVRLLVHNCDTDGGSSGSPLWVYDKESGRREVRGIHSHASLVGDREVPIAVKFQKDMFDLIQKWKNDHRC